MSSEFGSSTIFGNREVAEKNYRAWWIGRFLRFPCISSVYEFLLFFLNFVRNGGDAILDQLPELSHVVLYSVENDLYFGGVKYRD